MNIRKRILTCLIILAVLAVICLIGAWKQEGRRIYSTAEQTQRILQTMQTQQIFSKFLFNSEDFIGKNSKKIALTFDDGPHELYTEQLLDGLKERNVKASFFVTGAHAQENPEIIKRMHEEGHLIGNHTYSHMQLKSNNTEAFQAELIKTNEIISNITGEDVTYVRPPYGCWNKKFEKELNMFPVLWTIDPLDWCSSNVECITNTILRKADENAIILMHDEYDTTVTAALKAADILMEKGYTFVTVEEILFD